MFWLISQSVKEWFRIGITLLDYLKYNIGYGQGYKLNLKIM